MNCCEKALFNCTSTFEECTKDCECTCPSFLSDSTSQKTENVCKQTKSLPGEHCNDTSDCVDGLTCYSSLYTCRCPDNCSYEADNGACMCGTVSVDVPGAVYAVGIIVGLISVVIWAWRIKVLYKSKPTESPTDDEEHDDNNDVQMTMTTTTIRTNYLPNPDPNKINQTECGGNIGFAPAIYGANDPQTLANGPPTSSDGPPTSYHGPPTSSPHDPPAYSPYGPPVSSAFGPKTSSPYGPPTSPYGSPSAPYGPPTSADDLPKSTYGPPTSTYGPPTSTYSPPTSTYGPPTSTYSPPTSAYGPPTSAYLINSPEMGNAPYLKKDQT